MTTKTQRNVKPAASERLVAGFRNKAGAVSAKKGTVVQGGKGKAAKVKEFSNTARKLKVALDGPANTETPSATGPKATFMQTEIATNTVSKSAMVMTMLRAGEGATLKAIQQATGWQAHSVRGFLSGTVRKKMALALVCECGDDGIRRYRIDDAGVVA